MSRTTKVACDYPQCRNTRDIEFPEQDDVSIRLRNAGWLVLEVVSTKHLLDFCPSHKNEILPEALYYRT